MYIQFLSKRHSITEPKRKKLYIHREYRKEALQIQIVVIKTALQILFNN